MTAVLPTVEVEPDADAPAPSAPSRRRRRWSGRHWVFAIVVATMALAPIVVVFLNSFNTARPSEPFRWSLDNWRQAFDDRRILSSVENTLSLGVVRMVLAVIVGVVFSWLITRTNMPGRKAFELVLWIQFFIPALPMTLGWILLLDPDVGWANELMRNVVGGESGPLNIFSFSGIVWVHLTATTVPYIVILTAPTFRRMSTPMEESARMCGAGKFRTAMRVTLPLMLPSILAATLLGFIWSLKAFEVELILGEVAGLDVYSTVIYRFAKDVPPNYGVATALGAGFIVIVLIFALSYRRFLRGREFTTISSHTFNDEPTDLGRVWKWVAAGACWFFVAIAVLLPAAALVAGSFMRRFGFRHLDNPWTMDHWRDLFDDPLFRSSIGTSLWMGLWAVVLGLVLYGLIALFVVRGRNRSGALVDIAAWMPIAVPGVLMGLGLLWLYLGTPLRTVLYASLLGLVLAIAINHMPTGIQQMKSALLQVNLDHEHAARIAGASRWKTTFLILAPLLAPSLISVALLTFVSAVRDISTVVLLSGHETRPVSVLLLEYSASGELERASAIGVVLTVLMTAVAFVALRIGNKSFGGRS